MRLNTLAFLIFLAVTSSGSITAWAQAPKTEESQQEVVITATLRQERLSELPASVTVLDGETAAAAGVQHLQDVLGLIPNLNWSSGTSRPRYFQLRGIGEDEQFEGAPNSSIGFLIDEIDFSGIGMPVNLYDIEQIEVLRGPQGTVYGANALGGLISVRTREPRPEPEIAAQTLVGDYGTIGYNALAGGSIGDSGAAFRLTAQRYESDGFRRNTFLNRNDTNGYDESLLRGKVSFRPVDELQVGLTAMYADLDNGYDAFSLDNSRVTLSDKPGRDAQRSAALAANAEYSGFGSFTLRSVSTAADSDMVYSFDGDWGNDLSWGANGPYDYTSRFTRERRAWSQDLRLVSKESKSARSSWAAGLYVLNLREDFDQLDLYNGDVYIALTSEFKSTNYALYGQYGYALTDRLSMTVGSRVERRRAQYSDTTPQMFAPTETMFGGNVSLSYALTAQTHAYATLARGYKAGGFNVSAGVEEGRRQFDAEYLWNLETGIKGKDASGRFEAQGTLFYMRRTDQQVDTSVQDGLAFIFYKDNASRGENYGLEGTLIYRPIPQLEFSSSMGLLKTRYIGYQFGDRDLNGREQLHAPEYQIALGAQYRHPSGFMARLDTQSVDDFYYSASHDERSNPYTLMHLKFGYERKQWSAHAWIRNLFDEEYSMRGFHFDNEPPDFSDSPRRFVQAGDPRQFGVTFAYSFR